MYNLLIAIAASLVGFVLFSFILGVGQFKPLYGIAPGLFVGIGVYIYLARRVMKQIEQVANQVQQTLMAVQESPNPTPSMVERALAQAIAQLEGALPLTKWQFLIEDQLKGQIGQLHFMGKQYDQATPYLEAANKRNWVGRAMLAVLLYKRKSYDEMQASFEANVTDNPKESLLWNLYAYCLWKANKRDEALGVLSRATAHVGSDDKTQANIQALQQSKQMKMRGWNQMWYQFHLDAPPQQRAPQQIQMRRR